MTIPTHSRDPYSGKASILDVVELVNDRSPCSAAVSGKRSTVSSQSQSGEKPTHFLLPAGQVAGKFGVRAGAVGETGAKRSVRSLKRAVKENQTGQVKSEA